MAGRRRAEGFAFFAPLVGMMLMMPPIVLLFDIERDIFGIPLIVGYLFAVWLALIAASFILRRQLPKITDETDKPLKNHEAER